MVASVKNDFHFIQNALIQNFILYSKCKGQKKPAERFKCLEIITNYYISVYKYKYK